MKHNGFSIPYIKFLSTKSAEDSILENKSIEEIANSQKNFLSTKEVAAVLGISPLTFRRRAEEYAELFPIERVGRIYRIPKEPFIAYVRTGKAHK